LAQVRGYFRCKKNHASKHGYCIGVYESIRESDQSGSVSSSVCGPTRHWHLLHGLVSCIWGDFNKVHEGHIQRAFRRILCVALHRIWCSVSSSVGRHLCITGAASHGCMDKKLHMKNYLELWDDICSCG